MEIADRSFTEQIINTLDLSYLEDELTKEDALHLLQNEKKHKEKRSVILQKGYPGYDTSIGWFNYDDETVRINCRKAIAEGFTAMKLKVGSSDPQRDIRRAHIVREEAGDNCKVMLDANQQWNLPQALSICKALQS
jgi:L-alanine-DL-glutamate epimerase and related enzymes of enolase superfamily